MESENFIKQMEEIEVLRSIYGSDWTVSCEASRSYNISVKENQNEVILCVTMTPDYPIQGPPKYEISAPWMDRKSKRSLHYCLEEVYLNNIGETVIYQWVEKVREFLQILQAKAPEIRKKKNSREEERSEESTDNQLIINCPEIIHGGVIVDRKSSFQGHAAEVHSIEDVHAVINKLKQNKKIQNAKHNMYAYRIEKQTPKGKCMLQDCNDDGESHAGGRMLHLLQILDQKNTLAIVTRWYGGIQLGPDRFRHINNAARQVIQQAGLLKK